MELLNLFDNIEVKNETRIEKEDTKYLESIQSRLEKSKEFHFKMKELIESKEDVKYKDFKNTYDSGSDYNLKKLRESNYTMYIDEVNEFISAIYDYFNKKYACNLKIGVKRIKGFDAYESRVNDSFKKLKYYEEMNYNNVLDDIFEQLDGVSLADRTKEELKSYWKEKTKQYRDDYQKINIKNKKISLNGLVWLESKNELSYSSRETMEKLIDLISYFEYECIDSKFISKWSFLSRYGSDVVNKFDLNISKIVSLKIFKNGRVDIEFSTGIYAMEFVKEFMSYEV
ncbi:TPA: hypothetical protein ACF2DD_002092 [Clostridium perfringens]|uniref:hypothetical protein n=1 Tax=Clostridium perfringens TaxID=1502 RepID=UPI00096A43A0|nr:hypothetical protein [Clostridium perfringens]